MKELLAVNLCDNIVQSLTQATFINKKTRKQIERQINIIFY